MTFELRTITLLFGLLVLTITTSTIYSQDKTVPTRVDLVELERYAGLWYEIARIPNRFQKQCARGVTANYTLRDDGKVDVLNRCYKQNGNIDEALGLARVEDKKTNSLLKVSFFSILGWRPVWGDYWIIDLAEDYTYAVVCSPDRKYGWILAREQELPDKVLDGIFERIRQQGFQPTVFRMTDQSPPPKEVQDVAAHVGSTVRRKSGEFLLTFSRTVNAAQPSRP